MGGVTEALSARRRALPGRVPHRWTISDIGAAVALTALLAAPAPVLWAPPLTVIALMWPWREIPALARQAAAMRPANDNASAGTSDAGAAFSSVRPRSAGALGGSRNRGISRQPARSMPSAMPEATTAAPAASTAACQGTARIGSARIAASRAA